MKYTLEMLNANKQRLGALLESTSPFGSYTAGSVFYLAQNKAVQIDVVHHAIVLDHQKQPIVQTRLILGQDIRPMKGDDDAIPWAFVENTVPWPGL